jgi:hypothetical protein
VTDVLKAGPCVDAARHAARQSTEQHKLVNRYKDIAAKLCGPPLGYEKPEHWHGYIPPAYDPERIDGVTPLNDSPRRAALMALCEEAAERADVEQVPHDAAVDSAPPTLMKSWP